MGRTLVACTAFLILGGLAPAPSAAQRRPNRRALSQMLTGEKKLAYIAKQLFLNAEQQKAYDEMIEVVYQVKLEEATTGIQSKGTQLQTLYQAMQEARTARNFKKADDLQREMQLLSPTNMAETAFFEGVAQQLLDDSQIERMQKVRMRLYRNPSGKLHLMDAIYVARDVGLSPEQSAKVPPLMKKYRERMRLEVGPNDTAGRAVVRESFIKELRALLTTEQAKEYDRVIDAMRVEESPTKPAIPTLPGTPAGEGG